MSKTAKTFSLFILILGFFVFVGPANAAEVIDQEYTSSGANYCLYDSWSTPFIPDQNNISKVEIVGGNCSGGTCVGKEFQFFVCQGVISPALYSSQYNCGSNPLVYSAATTSLFSFTDLEKLPTPATLFPGASYYLTLYSPDTNFNVTGAGGGYSGQINLAKDCSAPHITEPDQANQFYFKEYYEDTVLTGADYVFVEKSFPKNLQEDVDNDFSFTGVYSNTLGIYDKLAINIQTGSSSPIIKCTNTVLPTGANIYVDITATSSLAFEVPMVGIQAGIYHWNAFLYDTDTNTWSKDCLKDYFSFTVQPVGGGHTPLESIYTMLPKEEYCNYESGNVIADAFNKVLCILFIPEKSYLEDLSSSTQRLLVTAPIGYITLAVAAVNSLATTTAATTTPVFLTASQYNIFKSASEIGIFSLIKNLISLLFLIVALVFVFKRLRALIKI